MDAKFLGNMYRDTGGRGFAGAVWDKNYLSPTITTMQGGGRQPMIIDEVRQVGNLTENAKRENPNRRRVYDSNGISPTLTEGMGMGGNLQPFTIVAMRGRNPENPSDRTPGVPTVQRLEPNKQGICNTLTSVTKDNLVMETVKIKNNNANGYEECVVGGVADFLYPSSTTRSGRVQENGNVSPTLTSENSGVCRIEKNDVYYDFYNKSVKKDGVCGTITSSCSHNGSGTFGVFEPRYRIRKLTPLECWRLMGFSDEDFHKAEQVNSNTQLYKQAGNSIVVDVLEAIFMNLL